MPLSNAPDVDLRLRRADQHLATLKDEIRQYAESKPYVPIVEGEARLHEAVAEWPVLDQATREALTRSRLPVVASEIRPVPESVPLIVGEFLHNLRAALDHIAWQLVEGHSSDTSVGFQNRVGRERMTAFPIYVGYPKRRDNRNFPVPELLRPRTTDAIEAVLDGLQPYKSADSRQHPLAVLKALNDTDKHQTLSTTVSVLGGGRVIFELPGGRIIGQRTTGIFVFKGNVLRERALEAQADLGSLDLGQVIPMLLERPGRVQVEADVQVRVSLNEPGSLENPAVPLTDALQVLLDFVRQDVVVLLEPFL